MHSIARPFRVGRRTADVFGISIVRGKASAGSAWSTAFLSSIFESRVAICDDVCLYGTRGKSAVVFSGQAQSVRPDGRSARDW